MVRALFVLGVLLVGVLGGIVASEIGVTDKSASEICNQQFAGDDWRANTSLSTDLGNSTRLTCIHENGTQKQVQVNASVGLEEVRG